MFRLLGYYIRGVLMGLADSVPGISGGTIAFVTGIYEHLVDNLYLLSEFFRRHLWKGHWHFLKEIDWLFLLALGAGIGTAIVAMGHTMGYLMTHYKPYVWATFAGLVLASIWILYRNHHFRLRHWLGGIIPGLLAGYLIMSSGTTQLPHTTLNLFLAGALAICAMILPGISGSTILVILNQYEYVLHLVRTLSSNPFGAPLDAYLHVFAFMLGMAIGLMTFVRLLHFLLQKSYLTTVASLTGLMVGVLPVFWPWQHQGQWLMIPSTTEGLIALAWCLVGMVFLLLIHRLLPTQD